MESNSSSCDDGFSNPESTSLFRSQHLMRSSYNFFKLTFFLLAAFAVVFSSCKSSDKNTVNVIQRSFEEEIQVTENLTFIFDKDIAKDSMLNQWDTIPYILFDPPVEGRFMWSSTNSLMFSPSAPFPPATDYEVELTDKIVKTTIWKLGKENKFDFHTPYLSMMAANFFWALPDQNLAQPALECNLIFNFPIDVKLIADNLEVEFNGEKKKFNLMAEENNSLIYFSVPDMKIEDKNIDYVVTLAEGMLPINGNKATDKPLQLEGTITSPFKVDITNMTTDHDGMDGYVTFNTSQEVSEKSVREHVQFEPALKNYDVQIDRESFTISSEEFSMDEKYTVAISAGLKGNIGGELKEDYTNEFMFGELEPGIEFADDQSTYMSGKGFRNLAVNITNVKKVTVRITKIYENNILQALDEGYYDSYGDYYDEYDYYYDDYYYDSYELGDIVYEETIETKTLDRQGLIRLLHLDFDDKVKEYKGLYNVSVFSEEDYWVKDRCFISITDVGLIAKEGKDKIYVFANSIKTAEPLGGVKLTFIAKNNQELGTATTNSEGVAEFTVKHKDISGFKTAMITARLGDDFTYIPYSRTRVENSQFDIGGRHENPTGMEAFIYGERDIYRPGETANITAIIRAENWQSPGEIPVKLKIISPSGKEIKSIKKTLNDQGSFETAFEIPSNALTGSYAIEVFTSNDVLLNSSYIRVEEFVPDRIKVSIKFDKTELKVDDPVNLDINAMNLFGTPAANRNYEVEMNLKQKYFNAKDYPEYTFYLTNTDNSFSSVVREGATDDEGNATEEFSVDPAYENMGMLQSDFYVTVFDETGRPVNQFKSLDVITQDVFYGIGRANYYIPLDQKVTFPLIATDYKGKAQSSVKADVQIIRYEYNNVLSKSGSYFYYYSQREERVVEQKEIIISGTSTKYSYTPKLSGEYEIRIKKAGVNTYVTKRFYSYGYRGTQNNSFEVDREGEIQMKFDKEVYHPGDKAKILLTAPFDGKMLVTIEQNEVLKDFYINTSDKAAEITVDVLDAYVPNVYIAATLIRAHGESDMPLTVANGFYPLNVENEDNKLDVTITATDKSRSNKKQEITVTTSPNAFVTIAVVDEGILQLTNFETPDPYGFFYQKKALEVSSFNVYPYLFPEISNGSSSSGGDDMYDLDKRTNPLTNKRFKLVSFWSGIQKANSSGSVTFNINIPQFSGDLRIMAVAYKGKQFGNAEAHMKVADPIVISPTIPRFVAPGDTIVMPVTMSNTTAKASDVNVTVKTEGLLKVVGSSTQKTNIKANSEGVVNFAMIAQQDIGDAKISITVNAMNENFLNETDITVRPSSGLQKVSGSGSIAGGKSTSINMDVSRFLPSSMDNKLIVSTNPMIEWTKDLDYLIQYPYGCAEQTISTAFPQIYYDDLAKLVLANRDDKNPNPAYHVQEAIRKIQSQQIYNGGITYWPDYGEVNWWITAFAGHFLLEAKKAGFDVDDKLLSGIFDYLVMRLKNKELIDYTYIRLGNKKLAPREVAYSLYVLAAADKAQTSSMNYYKSNPDLLTEDAKYLLAAAFYLSGDRTKYKDILPKQFVADEMKPAFGGSFYSYIRDEAVALNAMLDIDPNNQQVGIMAKHLSQKLKESAYLNTQERVFTFLALGKIAKLNKNATVTATVKSGGKAVATFKSETLTLNTKDLQGTNIEITTTGSGNLYYFWEAEGISKDGSYVEEDNYLRVRKYFFNRFGQPVNGNTFHQNDLIVVRIAIEAAVNEWVENVVITDILPAGFEIENPRLSNIPGTEWVKDESYADYQDIRDDRINLFVNVGQSTRYYYYVVRAVSLGTYQMGPVGADAMYNGEYHSYSGAKKIRVIK